jgi:membrane protein DedA with SNARE-associated domain
MSIENLILTFGYLAILAFMVTNGIVSLPSSQFIYVTAGLIVPSGHLSFLPIVIAGTIGNTLGNIILYEITRRKGLKHVAKWRGFSEEKITRLHLAFERKGIPIIIVGKFLPLVKVFVPVVAGMASMNRMLYAVIILITSFFWAMGLTYFGFYFGKNYSNGTFGWSTVVALIISGIAIYVFIKYIQRISLEK